ncbi:unnamed protein product [Fraxinus pennsylvanica]|uniref:Uncharacterized protein n=1 Tax=Fraxinus pennsylvanica TaxID=56036 RepID=A0AAD2AH49_9LAMI|nr:unnamed protein product [Fraxinus pennsylvanica]
MSSGELRKVSVQEIQLVQDLIKRCLQLYMSQKEVVNTLLYHAKIEPSFTELVWQKLEAENQEFFKAYHLRLLVKDHILQFNDLLERHVELIHQICPTEVCLVPLSNESQIMHNNSEYHSLERGPSPRQENMYQAILTVPNAYTDIASGTTLQPQVQVVANRAAHTGNIDISENVLLAQSSNAEWTQGMNDEIIKSECEHTGDSLFMFGAERNLQEALQNIGDASFSPFSSVDSVSLPINETILDPELNSFGFLRQIPRNISFSDLTADFSNSTDILESYSRSPFLGTDTSFMDPSILGELQDIERLDTVSEG